jgi:hypothetical protein
MLLLPLVSVEQVWILPSWVCDSTPQVVLMEVIAEAIAGAIFPPGSRLEQV